MPRKAPNQVTEHRITFGNYERQFVTGIKEDVEKAAKVTAVATFAVPVITGAAAVGGLGLLGYGLYRGLDSFGFGSLNTSTLGCIVRKYAIRMIPFNLGYVLIDDCDIAQTKHEENSAEANAANERKRQRARDKKGQDAEDKRKYGGEDWWGGGGGDF